MSYQDSLKDYVDVAERISIFREKYPTGCLQPANLDEPLKVFEIDGKSYVLYTACAYRTPDDERPGVGIAWELVPGATSFTRGSEAMNAETAAWGRAIVAVLAADTKRGIASAQEVHTSQNNDEFVSFGQRINDATTMKVLDDIANDIKSAVARNAFSPTQLKVLQNSWKKQSTSISSATPMPPNVSQVLPNFDGALSGEEVVSKVEEIKGQLQI